MIDDYNDDGTGWARFSDDRKMRYRLARSLNGHALIPDLRADVNLGILVGRRVTFLMLNPSTADAFDLDPTVNECRKRAIALGADVLEVVNLFALRSPYPTDLKKCAAGSRGDDATNSAAIADACTGAHMVIAAWGNHGALDGRDIIIQNALRFVGIQLHHLGLTAGGFPKHPLARGRHRIPADLQPIPWTVQP